MGSIFEPCYIQNRVIRNCVKEAEVYWYGKSPNISYTTVFNKIAHANTADLAQLASVAQLDAPSDWRPGGRGFNPLRGRQHSFVEIDHEIFSTVILSLPLIQEGQLSASGERMCTILVNRLED